MQQQVITADALIVATRPLSADIEIPGTILANETTEIHPEVSGRVVVLNVREEHLSARVHCLPNYMMVICRHS
jgi:multidrug efflux pump subunit AcrA (membrane-fusion protein)